MLEPETIMLSTICSGGCRHCPFSNLSLEQLNLEVNVIDKIITESLGNLIVLSGGEPFQHPQIKEILELLPSYQNKYFRIATGGFVCLFPWLHKLKYLCHNGSLLGISIGTDVISSRVAHDEWLPIWQANIKYVAEMEIPYSLTFTLNEDLKFFKINFESWDRNFKKPEFLYLRYPKNFNLNPWLNDLQRYFSNIPMLQDSF